ncbi:MAG: selenocysteine-specific translation elongation factor [Egibacteraceae bacterium]
MRVVCTAGHVDHGKSTLVRALTGMEPDRFEEERRRGLTIDLGFAWTRFAVPPGPPVTVAFVDLPGHERFVGNMLAGAGPVELALFVVAADEGWMPQSQEHLDILDLLGVRHGLVALTKADTVDQDTIDIGQELVREQLAGTAFAEVEIVPVSAVTGDGLRVLVERLVTLLATAPAAPDLHRPRLWIDRSFSVRGAGTVVTGTLGGGRLRVGDEVALLPGRRTARVRGMQSLLQPVDHAAPGSRVAVNTSGLDRAEVARGDALGLPGQWRAVRSLDVWIRALPAQQVGRKGAWHLHAGSSERSAKVYPLAGERLGQDGFARLVLDRAVALQAGDRFVLREAGRRATVGGGVALDVDPPPRSRGRAAREARRQELAARLDALRAGDRASLLALHIGERGAAPAARAAAAVGLVQAAARQAAAEHGLVELATAWAHPAAVTHWAGAIEGALNGYHTAHPVDRAAPKDLALRAAAGAGCPEELVAALLDLLLRRSAIVAEGPGLRTPAHRVTLDEDQTAARDALLAALAKAPFAPPGLTDAARAAGACAALVRELEAAKAIVRLGPDLAVTAGALDQAHALLLAAYDAEGPLTAARAKEVLGTSRKFALPVLEELDRQGRTRRRGDVRDVR